MSSKFSFVFSLWQSKARIKLMLGVNASSSSNKVTFKFWIDLDQQLWWCVSPDYNDSVWNSLHVCKFMPQAGVFSIIIAVETHGYCSIYIQVYIHHNNLTRKKKQHHVSDAKVQLIALNHQEAWWTLRLLLKLNLQMWYYYLKFFWNPWLLCAAETFKVQLDF